MKINKNTILAIVIFIILAIGAWLLLQKQKNSYEELETIDFVQNETEEEEEKLSSKESQKDEDIKQSEEDKIMVHISGEVEQRGIVVLDKESRIIDAINAAGGATEKADLSKINLAYVIEDGMKITIPSIEEKEDINNSKEYIEKDAGEEVIEENTNTKETTKEQSKININTATQTELETLPGIGPSIALKIINYRNENGKFTKIEDLKNVSGIGENKYEQIKEMIYV